MKKIILFAFALIMASCSSKPDCSYSKIEIKTYRIGNDELLGEKTFDNCFTVTDDNSNLVEIKNEEAGIALSYYKESNPNELKYLNAKFGDVKTTEFRQKKGHKIELIETENATTIIYHDPTELNLKGTITLYK